MKKYKDSIHGRYVFAKHDAKRKDREWLLSEEQYKLLATQPCYYCCQPISTRGIGLDRIDNTIGYTYENVITCCHHCNRTRGDRFTVEETKAIMTFIKDFRERKNE